MTAPPEDFDRHVQRVDPDRWLATRLIADPVARTEVLALYALEDELSRISLSVSQPMLGEIRLQWWREALERAASGGAADHPVLEALAPALRAGRLSQERLDSLLQSHEADFKLKPFDTLRDWGYWCCQRFGSVIVLAAGLLAPDTEAAGFPAAPADAWGWSVLLREEEAWRARGREPWPSLHAETPEEGRQFARDQIWSSLRFCNRYARCLPVAAFPAVAYVTLARDYRKGREPSDLAKRARLLWAAARGAV